MRTAIEHYGLYADDLRRQLPRMVAWLDGLPPSPVHGMLGLWSCHAIARAAQQKFFPSYLVVDGYFGVTYNHSWLRSGGIIIDVYPVASLSTPLIIDAECPGWARQYEPNDRVTVRIAERTRHEMNALRAIDAAAEPDMSDVPEAQEDFFERAELRVPK
jgi:hypothetical protein